MTKNPIENRRIIELRDKLQQLQDATFHLAKRQHDLTGELEQALLLVLELPHDDDDYSQFPKEIFVISAIQEDAKQPLMGSRVDNLRQQLLNGRKLAEDLLQQQNQLNLTLRMALQEALELRHAEVEGRNELGGEG